MFNFIKKMFAPPFEGVPEVAKNIAPFYEVPEGYEIDLKNPRYARVSCEPSRPSLWRRFDTLTGKYGFVDRSGEMVIPAIYDQVEKMPCGNALCSVVLNGKSIFINQCGDERPDPQIAYNKKQSEIAIRQAVERAAHVAKTAALSDTERATEIDALLREKTLLLAKQGTNCGEWSYGYAAAHCAAPYGVTRTRYIDERVAELQNIKK